MSKLYIFVLSTPVEHWLLLEGSSPSWSHAVCCFGLPSAHDRSFAFFTYFCHWHYCRLCSFFCCWSDCMLDCIWYWHILLWLLLLWNLCSFMSALCHKILFVLCEIPLIVYSTMYSLHKCVWTLITFSDWSVYIHATHLYINLLPTCGHVFNTMFIGPFWLLS